MSEQDIVRPIKFACHVSNADEREWAKEQLEHTKLINLVDIGDPTVDSGAALQLAERSGIELHKGTCYGTARAYLPKEKWIAEGEGWDGWVERGNIPLAICLCAIDCYRKGILSFDPTVETHRSQMDERRKELEEMNKGNKKQGIRARIGMAWEKWRERA